MLAPLTHKQVNYIKKSQSSWLNLLEGGKRGGKNVVNVIAWATAMEEHKNRIHLAAGVSVATAKLNIIDCDGFGLTYYFKGRCKEGKYKDRDCLYVQTKTGEKVILISGGGKLGDEKLITYGTALITEINECHPTFIKEVFDRTTSSTDRKIFADWNPKPPTHWFYTDVFDFQWKQQQADPEYGLNFAHVTIADNLSVSDEQLRRVLATYDKNTVWYKRDILGLRAAAEGLVFPQFANNTDRWIIPKPADNYLRLFCGVDFGGNTSKTIFTLVGILDGKDRPEIHILDCHHVRDRGNGVDSETITREFVEFVARAEERFKQTVYNCNTDHLEAQRLSMSKALGRKNIRFVDKSTISLTEWVKLIGTLFNLDMIKIVAGLDIVVDCFKGLLFDEKATDDRPLDDGKTCDVDTYDSSRYAIIDPLKDWLRRGILTA